MRQDRRKHGQDEGKMFNGVQTHSVENERKIFCGDGGDFGVFGAIGKGHEDAFAN